MTKNFPKLVNTKPQNRKAPRTSSRKIHKICNWHIIINLHKIKQRKILKETRGKKYLQLS